MKRASLAAALGTLILSGCGTIANFSGKGWDNTHIYGGVVRDVKSAEEWIEAKPITKDTELQQGIGTVVGTGLIVLDVPLSAIGDTLTLPITIPAAIWGTPSGAPNVSRKEGGSSSSAKPPAPAPDGIPPK